MSKFPFYYERLPDSEPYHHCQPLSLRKIIFITEERRTPRGQLISMIQTKAAFFVDDPEMERKFLREYSLQKLPREMSPLPTAQPQRQGNLRTVVEEGKDFWETKTTTEYFRHIPPSAAAATVGSPSPESMAFGEHWSARAVSPPSHLVGSQPTTNRETMSRQTVLREAFRMRLPGAE